MSFCRVNPPRRSASESTKWASGFMWVPEGRPRRLDTEENLLGKHCPKFISAGLSQDFGEHALAPELVAQKVPAGQARDAADLVQTLRAGLGIERAGQECEECLSRVRGQAQNFAAAALGADEAGAQLVVEERVRLFERSPAAGAFARG